jgi:hypothetical protein
MQEIELSKYFYTSLLSNFLAESDDLEKEGQRFGQSWRTGSVVPH